MHEHDAARKGPTRIQRVAEVEVVVVLQPHSTQDNQVDFGLQCDAREQWVVGFARACKNRELLRLHQGVEDVDHRDAGAHHVARNDALGRVDGRSPDLDGVVRQRRAPVTRPCGPGEHASQECVGERHPHRLPEKTHLRVCSHAARSGKHLQRNQVAPQPDDLRQRGAAAVGHFRELAVLDALGADVYHVSRDTLDPVINLMHCCLPPPPFARGAPATARTRPHPCRPGSSPASSGSAGERSFGPLPSRQTSWVPSGIPK